MDLDILVTGATGNVGRHVVAELLARWPFAAAARSLIHERDVAAVAARAVTEESRYAGRRLHLTGAGAITQAEQVRMIGEAIGRALRYQELPREQARRQLAEAWGDPEFADRALDTWAGFVTEPEPVTGTVAEVTGAPPRAFGEWAREHAADFGAAPPGAPRRPRA